MSPTSLEVREFMTRRLITASPDEHALDAIDRILEFGISGLPVLNDDNEYTGVFSETSSLFTLQAIAMDAERRCDGVFIPLRARDFMRKSLRTVSPDTPVLEAINLILTHRVSGLPVVDSRHSFAGVFSERSAMRVLIDMAWHQMPEQTVADYMDSDRARLITMDTSLEECAERFASTEYRRLPVVYRGRLLGQISRRDVMRAQLDTLCQSYELTPRDTWQNETPKHQWTVRNFTRTDAETITPRSDWLETAQRFFTTSARRFPVVTGNRLHGQVSRRDLLKAVCHLLPDPDDLTPGSGTQPMWVGPVPQGAVIAPG